MKIDFQQEGYNAYVSATNRLRWFILITVILSTLVVLQIYLERWSFSDKQLQSALANRLVNQTEYVHGRDSTRLNTFFSKPMSPDSASEFEQAVADAKQFAYVEYVQRRTNHTLDNVKLERLQIPLLGVSIPNADYMPVIAIMLAVFCIGVWLHIRTASAAISELLTRDAGPAEIPPHEMAQLIKMRFTFAWMGGGEGTPSAEDKVARVLEYSAYSLPLVAIVFGVWFDLYPILEWSGSREIVVGPPEAIAVRVVILTACIVAIALSTLSTTQVARRTNRLIHERELSSPDNRK